MTDAERNKLTDAIRPLEQLLNATPGWWLDDVKLAQVADGTNFTLGDCRYLVKTVRDLINNE